MGWLDRLRDTLGAFPPPDHDALDSARAAYASYLRALLVGLEPKRHRELLERIDVAQRDGGDTGLATLMGLETLIVTLMTGEQIRYHHWIVRDRLDRVGSPSGIARHEAEMPAALRSPAPRASPSPRPTALTLDDPAISVPSLEEGASEREAEVRASIAAELAMHEAGEGIEDDSASDAGNGAGSTAVGGGEVRAPQGERHGG